MYVCLLLTWHPVMKVLLGESPECEVENAVPSKSGLLTVLEVLKIQMKFWPMLESIFSKLESRWGTFTFPDRSEWNYFFVNSFILFHFR